MHSVGMRNAIAIHPGPFVVADGIDDERVAVPLPYGVSVEAGRDLICWRMRPAIHVDGAKRMGSSDIEDENALEFRHIENLNSVGRHKLTRSRRRFATRVRFIGQHIAMPEIR